MQLKMDTIKLKESVSKAGKALWNTFPVLLGAILLISLVNAIIPKSSFALLFKGHLIIDSLIGNILGSILAGNPITSYIIGGELLNQGISLVAVTAFIVSWVTVGLVQLPAESILLGKKFAITRNTTAFIFSIVVAILTVVVMNVAVRLL